MSGLSLAAGRRCRTENSVLRAFERNGAKGDELLVHSLRTWASITFSGTRHTLTYAFDGAEAVARGEALIEVLAKEDFNVPGHLVADASVSRVKHRADPPRLEMDLELLLLEEG